MSYCMHILHNKKTNNYNKHKKLKTYKYAFNGNGLYKSVSGK